MLDNYQEQLDNHSQEFNDLWKMAGLLLVVIVILCIGILYILAKTQHQQSQLDLLQQRLDVVASEHSIVVKRGHVDD